ncbi:VWA domain-containing protein [Candidatus Protochlamydia phocaeensis]|uniref:VWA domain-containing protein n=1 Tax=Candidatus Protochlamydia phocaeensis TaxID=1414722 RepID=UPI000839499C|nr:VWA domain-containing protein [Candidatus Protochlamydia phocaeensis]
MIRDIFFDFPQATYLLFMAIPLFCLYLALLYDRSKKTASFASSPILSQLLLPRSLPVSIFKLCAYSISWVLACLALMNPQGNLRYLPLASNQPSEIRSDALPRYRPHEIVLLVDTSNSMSVPDASQGQTRLDQAKDIMNGLVSQLKGPTVSLYSFTSTLTQLVPPTNDYIFTRLMIKSLTFDAGDVGGTSYQKILSDLKDKLFPVPTSKLYTLIILSDGGDNKIEELKGEEREKAMQAVLNALPNPNEFHFRLFTVGIGSLKPGLIPHVTTLEGKPVYSQLDPTLLKQLAQRYQGQYYQAQEWTSWNLSHELFRQIQESMLEQQMEPARSLERKVSIAKKDEVLSDLYFQVPLGLAILLLTASLILPNVRRL